MLSKKAYRDLIRKVVITEVSKRPRCAITWSIGVDTDTELAYIHFTCLSHSSSWRDFIDATPDLGPNVDSPCPAHGALDGKPDPTWLEAASEPEVEEVTDAVPTKKRKRS